ncbi:MAG: type II toxin-antitoxin system RelE family toxin [Puniceicoccales bacterium]
MSWDYKVSERAVRQLRKMDRTAAQRIILFLDERITGTDNPRIWGKQLKGELNNLWRYRVGDYRILCEMRDDELIVLVVRLGHRREIYD